MGCNGLHGDNELRDENREYVSIDGQWVTTVHIGGGGAYDRAGSTIDVYH